MIRAERLAVEEDPLRKTERLIEVAIVRAVKSIQIDAQFFEQRQGRPTVAIRTIDRLGAAVHQEPSAADLKLVSLGVPAEIVVIIEHEHARGRSAKVGRGEATDPAADDNDVVVLTGGGGRVDQATNRVIPRAVRDFE